MLCVQPARDDDVEMLVRGLPDDPDGPAEVVEKAYSACRSGKLGWGVWNGVLCREIGGEGKGVPGRERGRMLFGSCGNGGRPNGADSGDGWSEYAVTGAGKGICSVIAEGGVMLIRGGSLS